MVAWVFAVTIEGGDLASYLLPSPLILVVGGSRAGLLIAYGASGVGALPGLFGLALRGPTSASGASSAEIAARYRLGQHLFRDAGHFSLLSGVVATLPGLPPSDRETVLAARADLPATAAGALPSRARRRHWRRNG